MTSILPRIVFSLSFLVGWHRCVLYARRQQWLYLWRKKKPKQPSALFHHFELSEPWEVRWVPLCSSLKDVIVASFMSSDCCPGHRHNHVLVGSVELRSPNGSQCHYLQSVHDWYWGWLLFSWGMFGKIVIFDILCSYINVHRNRYSNLYIFLILFHVC